jgi:hypothetical protein
MISTRHPLAGVYAWLEELAEVLEDHAPATGPQGFPFRDMQADARRARQLMDQADQGYPEALQGLAAKALQVRWSEAMQARLQ